MRSIKHGLAGLAALCALAVPALAQIGGAGLNYPLTALGPASSWARQYHQSTGGGIADVIGIGCPHKLVWTDQNITACLDSATYYSFDRSISTYVAVSNVGGQHPNVGDAIGVNWITWGLNTAGTAWNVSTTHNVRYTIQTADCAAAPTGAVCGGSDATTLTNIALKLGKCLDGTGSNCTGNTTLVAALAAYTPDSQETLFRRTGYQAYQTPAESQQSSYGGNPATLFDQPWTSNGASLCNGQLGCNITAVSSAHTTVTVTPSGTDANPIFQQARFILGRGAWAGDSGPNPVSVRGSTGAADTNGDIWSMTTNRVGTHGPGGSSDTNWIGFSNLVDGSFAQRVFIGAGLFTSGQTDPGADAMAMGTLTVNGGTIGSNKAVINGSALIGGVILNAPSSIVSGAIGYSAATFQSNGDAWNFNNAANNITMLALNTTVATFTGKITGAGLVVTGGSGNVAGGLGYSAATFQSNSDTWTFNNSANSVTYATLTNGAATLNGTLAVAGLITGSSLNLNGATLGTHKLAVNGTAGISGVVVTGTAGNAAGGIGYVGATYQTNGDVWNFNNATNGSTLATLNGSGLTLPLLNAVGTIAGSWCSTAAGLFVYKVGANCF